MGVGTDGAAAEWGSHCNGLEEPGDLLLDAREPCRLHEPASPSMPSVPPVPPAPTLCDALRRWHRCPELHKAIDGINYIAEQTRKEEDSTRVSTGSLVFLGLFTFTDHMAALVCR